MEYRRLRSVLTVELDEVTDHSLNRPGGTVRNKSIDQGRYGSGGSLLKVQVVLELDAFHETFDCRIEFLGKLIGCHDCRRRRGFDPIVMLRFHCVGLLNLFLGFGSGGGQLL